MDEYELKRFEKLNSIKFRKFDLLHGYKQMDSLEQVQTEAQLDLALVNKLKRENPQRYEGVFNLLHNFVWFICYSNGNTEPATLWEDDIHGISYYGMMQDIRDKFHKEYNGEEADV